MMSRAVRMPRVRVTRASFRRTYATSNPAPVQTTPIAPTVARSAVVGKAKKKKRYGLRFTLGSLLLASIFYTGSVFGSQYSERYRDFFVQEVPLGERLVQLFEDRQVDKDLIKRLSEKARVASGKTEELTKQRAERLAEFAKRQAEKAQAKAASLVEQGKDAVQHGKEAIQTGADNLQKSVEGSTAGLKKEADAATEKVKAGLRNAVSAGQTEAEKAKDSLQNAAAVGEQKAKEAKDSVKEVVEAGKEEVENIVKTGPSNADIPFERPNVPVDYQKPRQVDGRPQAPKVAPTEVYTGPALPLGFEPPPGYSIPKAVKADKAAAAAKAEKEAPPPLPLVAPTVSELSASEPVLGQLASTIDSLSRYLNDSPSAVGDKGAREVINVASIDLKNLGARLEGIKAEEREKLEKRLEEKAAEYSQSLFSAEKEMVERLEKQEDDWKATYDAERKELIAAYREKLDGELAAQKEIIEQRLQEEVVAQGIEMQRKWLSEIKERVETERSGRLGKLESLQENFEKLGKTTLENSDWLEQNRHVNKLWTAIRAAWQSSVDSNVDNTAFARELAALSNVSKRTATATGSEGNSTIDAVIATIPESVQNSGVESLPTLASWFSDRLVPKIRKAALLPSNGGFASYLSSAFLSNFLFSQVGFVQGDDVISTLSRAEWYLTHRDLESAAREVNQLTGWPKILARDWLEASRRHLEVRQALQVAEAEAGLASLLIS